MPGSRRVVVGLLGAVLGATVAGCGPVAAVGSAARPGTVGVVAGESQYGNVVSQVGGPYVSVYSVETDPNTDPHTYEATPAVAAAVAHARLLVDNGLGYDAFLTKLAAASLHPGRRVLDVQALLGVPDGTANPHLWYAPATMPAVARAAASDLAALDPSHAATFRANAARFVASLGPWTRAVAAFRARYGGTPVATTEPVADDLLSAMGARVLTPSGLELALMNGTDPTPQDIATEDRLLADHRVKVLCYNEQVTDGLTAAIRRSAERAGIPVVGVYETMPAHGYDYQSWMLAETRALTRAVATGASSGAL